MTYQLVLQWPTSSIDDIDEVVRIEDRLNEAWEGLHDVDGHDAGQGQVNIFVITDDPIMAYEEAKGILGEERCWKDVCVAYRALGASKYVVLWPKDCSTFSIL